MRDQRRHHRGVLQGEIGPPVPRLGTNSIKLFCHNGFPQKRSEIFQVKNLDEFAYCDFVEATKFLCD